MACTIKLFMTVNNNTVFAIVIHLQPGKFSNIRLGLKRLAVTNMLAYNSAVLFFTKIVLLNNLRAHTIDIKL